MYLHDLGTARLNPYSTHRPWPPEVMKAYQSMPIHNGHIAPYTEQFRHVWREWAKKTPKHLWNPHMVEAYNNLDRQKRIQSITRSQREST